MKVKKLLNKNNWIKDAFAETNTRDSVSPLNRKATRFDLVGAIQRCYRDRNLRKRIYRKINNTLVLVLENRRNVNHTTDSIVNWNDRYTTKFSDVKRLVNKLNI